MAKSSSVVFERRLGALTTKCQNLGSIEEDVEAIREEILQPVNRVLKTVGRFNALGVWVGIAGAVLSMTALITSIALTNVTSNSVARLTQQTRYLGPFPQTLQEITRLAQVCALIHLHVPS